MDGPGQSVPDYLQAASSITADGYICEASIEYAQMSALDFSAGNTIGIHPCIDDTDIDGGDTEYQMSWTGLPAHDQSMGYGHMLLSDEPVPAPESGPVNPGTDGLVVSYALDGDVIDGSGNGLDGTMIGEPNFVDGMYGMALDLDGVDDYVDCGANETLNTLSDAITVSAWVNIRSVTTTWMSIVMKGETAWRLGVNGDTTGVHWAFTGGDRGWQAANSVTELPLGEWHHIAGTYDRSVGGTVWVDGVAETVNPDLDGIDTNEQPLLLGENPESTGRFFDGLLDEVRIYGRALSEAELRYLAGQRANPVDPGTDGLVAFYALDGDSNDSSGNGNDGTLFGDQLEWAEGKVGGALSHGGLSDAGVEIPTTGMSATAGTVAMWGLLTDPQPAQTKYFFGHTTQPQWSNRVQLYMNDGDNLLDLGLGDSHNRQNDIVDLPMDQWLHVALTWDSNDYVVYLNGENVATGTYTGFTDVNEVANIGNDGSREPYEAFAGLLDEVVIYSRALSDGEIRYLAGFREATLSGLSDVTVVDGAIESVRDGQTEYVIASGDLILGITTRWYVLEGVETLWAEGDPAPAATVSGTSSPKGGDVGSKADNFNFTLEGGTNISSIDGIDFQETIFPSLVDTIILFERGGNDVGTWQAIHADGSLGAAVEFVKSNDGGPYASTGVDVNGQTAYGVVFKTSVPVQGVRITASGHDTLSISAVP
jgi:hypothetical protein